MKRLAILGSTGSIGTSTLKVVAGHPDRFAVTALAAGGNVATLVEQARRFRPSVVSLASEEGAAAARQALRGSGVTVLCGEAGLHQVAAGNDADVVVAALVGALGLQPVLDAIRAGKDVALANKETLVVAGELVTRAAAAHKVRLLPVDSEHAALHQILDGRPRATVAKLVLTASGGPFRTTSFDELRRVTVAQALRHPTWEMGAKITVDSATLANKGLEVIEARFLFDVEPDRIDVLVHPQSTVHALVELVDGTVLAQLGVNDMCSPIQYALTYPERVPVNLPPLDLVALGTLAFEAPDLVRFPCLRLARESAAAGGTAPAVFNAANEVANEAFRDERLDFLGIPAVIEATLERPWHGRAATLDAVLAADREARAVTAQAIEERAR